MLAKEFPVGVPVGVVDAGLVGVGDATAVAVEDATVVAVDDATAVGVLARSVGVADACAVAVACAGVGELTGGEVNDAVAVLGGAEVGVAAPGELGVGVGTQW